MSAPRPLVALVALTALTVAACGSAGSEQSSESAAPATPVPTISGVGKLPDTVPVDREPLVLVTRPVQEDGTPAELVGETIDGNRVLVIGDSIMASTARRYGGQMCDELVPLGWAVEVEAEPSRFIDFGNRVLDRVLDDDAAPEDDWDAAVVFLGSNYGRDKLAYESELREILYRLAPRPTLLFTVTEYRPSWSEVNEVVAQMGEEFDNVTIVDWKTIAETPGVLSGDRLHPTEAGRQVLAEVTASALGTGDLGAGECLGSSFTDDSAANGNVGGGSSVGGSTSTSGGSSSSSSSSGSTSSSTTGGSTSGSTTGGSSTSSGTTTSGSGGTGGSTVPPVTDATTGGSTSGGSTSGGAPTTSPPASTSPPPTPTEPPPTQPPPTEPPPTPTQPPPTAPPSVPANPGP